MHGIVFARQKLEFRLASPKLILYWLMKRKRRTTFAHSANMPSTVRKLEATKTTCVLDASLEVSELGLVDDIFSPVVDV